MSLPEFGRKSANVVLNTAFNKGKISSSTNLHKIEQDLRMQKVHKKSTASSTRKMHM